MNKKFIIASLASAMLVGQFSSVSPVLANTVNQQISENEQLSELSSQEIKNLKDDLKQLQEEERNTENELKNLEQDINSNKEKMNESAKALEEAHQLMEQYQEEIKHLEEKIDARNGKLDNQARSIQLNGSANSQIEFLLSAESVSDLIGRIDVVRDVVSSNQSLVEEQARDKEELQVKTVKTEKVIEEQNKIAEERERASENLLAQQAEQEVLLSQLAAEKASNEEEQLHHLNKRKVALANAESLRSDLELARNAAQEAENTRAQASTEESSSQNQSESLPSDSEPDRTAAQEAEHTRVQDSSNESSSQNQTVQTSSSQETSEADQPAEEEKSQKVEPSANGSVLGIGSSFLGSPYVLGGTSPSGFDCSGFTSYVFNQAGRSIPRTSGGQYAAATKVSNPSPGDLVFFGTGGVSHVGIYAGNGQFLGSQTSTGVAYASVHSGYWGARFIGYGRL